MDTRPVAVVIPSFNRFATLRACIESIRATAGHPDYEILVVDSGSTDGSLAWLEAQEDVRVIPFAQRGVASAVNVGIAAAGRRDVVRVHSDVVFETEGWLKTLSTAAKELPQAGVIGGKLVLVDGRIFSVGRTIVSGVGQHERHVHRKRFAPDPGPGGSPEEVDAVPGALSYMTREVLDATGGLDEGYWPMYGDDDDFCMMARYRGFKVYVHPGVTAVHYSSTWTPTTERHLLGSRTRVTKLAALKDALINVHVEHWTQKWGWNPQRPDLGRIRRLYGDSEICWRIGEAMRFRPAEWPPAVDVVMVTWNNLPVLRRCLESVAATRYPADRVTVHVTDNGSTDGTIHYLEALAGDEAFPFRLVVHGLPVNTGVAVGYNWSICHGEADLVARMDDDVIVPPEWLDTLVETFRRRPYAGVVGPKILNDNVINDIQCGPFRMYPFIYGHENEPDDGQADYVARVAHVRGCLNIYRRDVLDRCGMFDLRFSPSQYDDPDHHAALGAVGYEIIYDGRVGVIHALNAGAGKTTAALSNQAANQMKLFGKWGRDIWKIIEQGIEMSDEGRFLPDDGDTSTYLSRPGAASDYPRFFDRVYSEKARESRLKVLFAREESLGAEGPFQEVWNDILDQARSMRRDGAERIAVDILGALVDLLPHRWDLIHEFALSNANLGEVDRAELLLKRARRLAPDQPALNELGERIAAMGQAERSAQGAATGVGDSSGQIGEPCLRERRPEQSNNLRVLMVNTYERRVAGGDMHQIKKTAQYLREQGVDVTISYTPRPDPTNYDLVHAFNLWFPQQTLPQVKGIRVAAPNIPIVMTPIYWDMAEKGWADHVVPRIFAGAKTRQELDAKLEDLANDALAIDGRKRSECQEPNFAGYQDYQVEILKHVDYLLPNSELEVRNLKKTLDVTLPYNLVHNGAEPELFDAATPDLFHQKYGLKNFVLTVGLIENRKNQLMLLHALKDTGIPVVVIGRNYDRPYLRLCQENCARDTLFIEHMPHAELASAMKAARVFALPSWMECAAFANVEAALAGCAMVVSDRTSEPEYFGDCAYYCDPASVDSIRDAVLKAYRYHETDAPKRERLRERFTKQFTWENAAKQVLTGYRSALAMRRAESAPVEATQEPELVPV